MSGMFACILRDECDFDFCFARKFTEYNLADFLMHVVRHWMGLLSLRLLKAQAQTMWRPGR
jgi:hypothetical protein